VGGAAAGEVAGGRGGGGRRRIFRVSGCRGFQWPAAVEEGAGGGDGSAGGGQGGAGVPPAGQGRSPGGRWWRRGREGVGGATASLVRVGSGGGRRRRRRGGAGAEGGGGRRGSDAGETSATQSSPIAISDK